MIITHTPTLMSPSAANSLADELNRDADDDWTFKAKHCPKGTGRSLVEVYDEEGFLLGAV